IEARVGRLQPFETSAVNDNLSVAPVHLRAQGAHCSQSRLAIGSIGVITDARGALGDGRQQGIPMRDRFVAGQTKSSRDTPGGGDSLFHEEPPILTRARGQATAGTAAT